MRQSPAGKTTTYLTGVVNQTVLAHAHRPDLGVLITPDTNSYRRFIPDFGTWAADNGCFSQTKVFSEVRWVKWLASMPREGCLWATAPDVVGDHEATLARSSEWLPVIRGLGFNAAFVVQNGATVDNVPWDAFDVMFVGGTTECVPCGYTRPAALFRMRRCPTCGRRLTEWKTSPAAVALIREAQARGKGVHVGRVSIGGDRFDWCRDLGVDTADGTALRFNPHEGVTRLLAVLDGGDARPALLPLFAACPRCGFRFSRPQPACYSQVACDRRAARRVAA